MQAGFAASWRPATVTEFNQLTGQFSNETDFDSFLTILNNGTGPSTKQGIVYENISGTWSMRQLSAGSSQVLGQDGYAATDQLSGIGLWGVSWYCDTTSTPVNVKQAYVGLEVNDQTTDSCICQSTYSGPSCSVPTVLTTAASCTNSVPSTDAILDGVQTVDVTVNSTEGVVVINLTIPQVISRNYTGFLWGTCGSMADDSALRSAATLTQSNSCNDVYRFSFLLWDLVSTCNLTKVSAATTTTYRGDLKMFYEETVFVNATNSSVLRASSVITPIDLSLNSTMQASLDDNQTVAVYSPFQLTTAVSGTLIKQDATTSLVAVTLGLQAPYTVIGIFSPPTSLPNIGVPPLADVCPLSRFCFHCFSLFLYFFLA